jgi:hypothetical protein
MGLRTDLGIRPPGRCAAGRAIRWTAGTASGAWLVAREVTGPEAEQVWASGRAVYRGFATYPAMARELQIRVFVLEPAAP